MVAPLSVELKVGDVMKAADATSSYGSASHQLSVLLFYCPLLSAFLAFADGQFPRLFFVFLVVVGGANSSGIIAFLMKF